MYIIFGKDKMKKIFATMSLPTIGFCIFLSLLGFSDASILSFFNEDLSVKIKAPFDITEEVPKNCHNLSKNSKTVNKKDSSVIAVNCMQVWELEGCQGRTQKIRAGSSTRSPERIEKVPFEIRSFQLCSSGNFSEQQRITGGGAAAGSGGGGNSSTSKTLNELGLELHNQYRKRHGAPDLTIEENLLNFDEINKRFGSRKVIDLDEPYGQNEAYIDSVESETEAVRQAIELWYAESENYDFSNPGYDDETRHFTQLVWKASTEFAIGVYRFESADPKWKTYFVMARYNPEGNVDGQYEANVLPAASNPL